MLDTTDGFKKYDHDVTIEHMIVEYFHHWGMLTTLKHFPVLARRQWLKRFLAHTELFKQTLDVPGDILELGVYRGLGLFTWANLLECYCIGDRTKQVIGFDDWAGHAGFTGASHAELIDAIAIFDADRFIPHKPRINLVIGNITETVPAFIEANPGRRYSLVHFDCDLYEPTLIGLQHIWPKVSIGGIVIFDQYSIPDWPGETDAVDRFLSNLRLRKLPWTNSPAAYVVKQ